MNRLRRLEEVLPGWWDRSTPAVEEAVTAITRAADAVLSERVDPRDAAARVELTRSVREGAERFARDRLVPDCLAMLRDRGDWENGDAPEARVRTDLERALSFLPAFEPELPSSTAQTASRSVVVPAVVGATLGALALGALTFLAFGQREVGLFLGGILGAATAAELAARLRAFRPRAVAPARTDCVTALAGRVRDLLRHHADLVLAWCWAHPDRLKPKTVHEPGEDLPAPVCDALTSLRETLSRNHARPEDIRDEAEILMQRFEEAGYTWVTLPVGIPLDGTIQDRFDAYGVIAAGQLVRVRRQALLRNGSVVRRGLIQRPQ